MIRDIEKYLQSILTDKELETLREINRSKANRHAQIRDFFHLPTIFNKVKETVDPTWLSTQIFINGKYYEF